MSTENEQTETTEMTEVEAVEASTEALQESEQTSEELGPQIEEPDFAALTGFVEDDVEEVVEETPTEPPPVEAETEVTEETVEQEAAPPEESADSVESESEEAEEKEEVQAKEEESTEEEAEQPEPVKLPTREELEGLYAEHREKTLPELEKVFTLSDEEAAALDEQPSKVLPKLAAQLQYDVMLSTYNAVLQALPSVVGTLNHTTNLANQAHEQFMKEWPDLADPKAEPAVKAAIQAYRAANPRASLEDTIKNAGVMAMINLGLDPTKKAAAPKPAPKPRPPKPAAPTGQQPAPPVKSDQEENVFSELAAVFEENQR